MATHQFPANTGESPLDQFHQIRAFIRFPNRRQAQQVLQPDHGARDDVVPPEQSRRMVAALQREGADVRYTEFPDANHNSWDAAYATPGLWEWLLRQRR